MGGGTYNAQRAKLEPIYLLTEHRMKPITTDGDIFNNYASELARTYSIACKTAVWLICTSLVTDWRFPCTHSSLTVLRIKGYPLSSWLLGIHHTPNVFCYPAVCTHVPTRGCECVCVCCVTTLTALRFTALDSQSSARRTQTITPLPQFICHGTFDKF